MYDFFLLSNIISDVDEQILSVVVSVLWLADAADTTSVNTVKDLKEFGLPQTCAGADQLASKFCFVLPCRAR